MSKFRKMITILAAVTMMAANVSLDTYASSATLKGDADLNGTVDIADLTRVSKYNLNKEIYPLENETALANADMNDDGIVDGLDTSILIEKQLGKEYIAITDEGTVELTADLKPYSVQASTPGDKFTRSQMDFAVSLLKKSMNTESNTLISPYSAVQAMAMTANGAGNNTLKEIMDVIGSGMSIGELNDNMAAFNKDLQNGPDCKLLTANSIWYKNDHSFSVDKDFLLRNKSFFNAQIFASPMNSDTLARINGWVNENTDGMIPNMLNILPEDTVMTLINAVAFEGEWSFPFISSHKAEDFFTAADGSKQDAAVLSNDSYYSIPCFHDNEASGFMKHYKGDRYAFAAILPNEDIPIDKYVQGLTGEKLNALLGSVASEHTRVSMPEFNIDAEIDLKSILKEMGIKEAFTSDADFSRTGNSAMGNICIGDALQKAHIELDANGTRAAAATTTIMIPVCAFNQELLIFNRPFVYAIIDTQTNIPIFMGTLLTLK